MSEEREKVTITTPVEGIEVVLKAWLTGREQRAIRSIYLDQVKLSANDSIEDTIKKADEGAQEKMHASYSLDGTILSKAQDAQIEQVVYSVGGKKEAVLDSVLDMRNEDFTFVMDAIKKILGDTELSEEDKKK